MKKIGFIILIVVYLIFTISVICFGYNDSFPVFKAILDKISIIINLISLLGFGFLIYQIFSLKTISEATQKAIEYTKDKLNFFSSAFDIPKNISFINEVRIYIKNNQNESANLRLDDLHESLIHLKKNLSLKGYIKEKDYELHLKNLCTYKETLKEKEVKNITLDEVEKLNIISGLDEIKISLNNLSAIIKQTGGK